jgi:hypothetical protein
VHSNLLATARTNPSLLLEAIHASVVSLCAATFQLIEPTLLCSQLRNLNSDRIGSDRTWYRLKPSAISTSVMLVCVACSAKHARDSRWAAAKYLQQILDIEWLQSACAHRRSCDDSSFSAEVT